MLILDNHDNFGGHTKRVIDFAAGQHTLLLQALLSARARKEIAQIDTAHVAICRAYRPMKRNNAASFETFERNIRHQLGHTQFGRISIANSDADGGAYTDSAINQGHRAAMELLQTEQA
jgi:hypothetical protein